MNEKKNRALHWPIGIFLAIVAVVILGIWTIEKANENPVVIDDFYFDKYQDVELNYNKIQEAQIAFDKKYNITSDTKEFKIGENSLTLTITDKQGNPVSTAIVKVKITRPFTREQDMMLKVLSHENGIYKLSPFKIDTVGRWQILSKVSVGDATSFTKTDINATK